MCCDGSWKVQICIQMFSPPSKPVSIHKSTGFDPWFIVYSSPVKAYIQHLWTIYLRTFIIFCISLKQSSLIIARALGTFAWRRLGTSLHCGDLAANVCCFLSAILRVCLEDSFGMLPIKVTGWEVTANRDALLKMWWSYSDCYWVGKHAKWFLLFIAFMFLRLVYIFDISILWLVTLHDAVSLSGWLKTFGKMIA